MWEQQARVRRPPSALCLLRERTRKGKKERRKFPTVLSDPTPCCVQKLPVPPSKVTRSSHQFLADEEGVNIDVVLALCALKWQAAARRACTAWLWGIFEQEPCQSGLALSRQNVLAPRLRFAQFAGSGTALARPK